MPVSGGQGGQGWWGGQPRMGGTSFFFARAVRAQFLSPLYVPLQLLVRFAPLAQWEKRHLSAAEHQACFYSV